MPISLEDINNKALARGITMIPTNFIGGTKNNNRDKFEIDEKEHLVKKCPSGHKPVTSKFKEGSHRARFDKKHCNNCPLRDNCLVIKQKRSYLFKVSEKTLHCSQFITKMGDSRVSRVS